MAATTAEGVAGVQDLVGRHLGCSDWVEITQERVDRFAQATGDHQWIHVDPLMPQIVEITGFRMGVNYGTDKVRFPAPVPVGSRVRAGATLDSATPFEGGVQMVLTVTVEVEGGSKPAMVATTVSRRYL
jgi:acyl dehydratase